MISEPYTARPPPNPTVPLNMDLQNLGADYDYAKRAKDPMNYERIHA